MTNKEIYKIWAPFETKWIEWIKPIPFVGINEKKTPHEFIDYDIPDINYLNQLKKDTALILDIPGVDSIKEGIALAKIGYRPIPLFNGTNPQGRCLSTTNNEIIETMLTWGAYELKNIKLEHESPPVFLLDDNRLNRYKNNVSVFDNSWDIYHQDLPTAKYFLENGINNIITKGETINKDLKKILYKYQQEGIKIFFTNGYEEPKIIKIKKPFRYNEEFS